MSKWRNSKVYAVLLILALAFSVIPSLPSTNAFASTTTVDAPQALKAADLLLPVNSVTEVPDGYIGITTLAELDAVRNNLDGNYILLNNLVFTPADFGAEGAFYNAGNGWLPIGDNQTNNKDSRFTGIFDGNGFSISGMTITTQGSLYPYVGLFGFIDDAATIKNLAVSGSDIQVEKDSTNTGFVGGIVGRAEAGTQIVNCSFTGYIRSNETASITTTGTCYTGGIAGEAWYVESCKNTGQIGGCQVTGGVVGIEADLNGLISKCMNSGVVFAYPISPRCGGIAGILGGRIEESYNIGFINARSLNQYCYVGGIVAEMLESSAVSNCFNTRSTSTDFYPGGTVGVSYIAGIAGYVNAKATISYCYNSSEESIYKFAEEKTSETMTHCYYYSMISGGVYSMKRSISDFANQAMFPDFDFSNIWCINTQIQRPVLKNVSPSIYQLTLRPSGGSLPAGSINGYLPGRNNPLPTPRRTGYTYLGWVPTGVAGQKPLTYIAEGEHRDLDYTAVWGAPIVSAKSYSYNSIKVIWNAAGGATSYRIYRATSPTGTYSYVHTALTSEASWIDKGRVTGKNYYYKVYPVAGGKTYYFSTYKYAYARPVAPSMSLSKASATSIRITWTGVAGATKYQIFRYSPTKQEYIYIATVGTTSRSWTNIGLTAGKTYYYKVRAYHMEGVTRVYGYSSPARYLHL